jgi:two-component system chemotaxis response regulator CheY
MKILLVEDSRTIRNIQKTALASMGHTDVLEAANGFEALSVLSRQRPDLVLVDWHMPRMDGITLVRRVREHDEALPMIMITTEAEKSKVMEALRAGVNNYVVKPFTAATLGSKIEQTMTKTTPSAGTA